MQSKQNTPNSTVRQVSPLRFSTRFKKDTMTEDDRKRHEIWLQKNSLPKVFMFWPGNMAPKPPKNNGVKRTPSEIERSRLRTEEMAKPKMPYPKGDANPQTKWNSSKKMTREDWMNFDKVYAHLTNIKRRNVKRKRPDEQSDGLECYATMKRNYNQYESYHSKLNRRRNRSKTDRIDKVYSLMREKPRRALSHHFRHPSHRGIMSELTLSSRINRLSIPKSVTPKYVSSDNTSTKLVKQQTSKPYKLSRHIEELAVPRYIRPKGWWCHVRVAKKISRNFKEALERNDYSKDPRLLMVDYKTYTQHKQLNGQIDFASILSQSNAISDCQPLDI